MLPRTTFGTLVIAAAIAGCAKDAPLPAPDPQGADIVAGAVVAAATNAEKTPGMRLYKVVHVDDYPPPIGHNYHLIAFDPKTPTFEEARALRRRGGMKVVVPHMEVRAVDFLPRDHRVVAVEPVTVEELKAYEEARLSSSGARRPPARR